MIGTWYWKIPKVKVKSLLTPFSFYAAFAEQNWNPVDFPLCRFGYKKLIITRLVQV